MSDEDVIRALDAIDRLLETKPLDVKGIASCRLSYESALASAERGANWSEIALRIQATGARVNDALEAATKERNAIKAQLQLQAKGSRALSGYRPR